MKSKNSIITSLFLIFSLLLIVLGVGLAQKNTLSNSVKPNVTVNVKSSKEVYSQGEIVPLDFIITSNETSDVFLNGTSVDSGYLWIYIASSNGSFQRYYRGGVKKKTKGLNLKAGQSTTSQTTLLWNAKPKPEEAGQAYIQDRITTDYAFLEPGVYLIKAKLIIPRETNIEIESNPIQIVVNEPLGNDLAIWNLIKDRSDIAYFMQEGASPTYKKAETEKLISEIGKIITENPDSLLADQMKQGLEKFRINERK